MARLELEAPSLPCLALAWGLEAPSTRVAVLLAASSSLRSSSSSSSPPLVVECYRIFTPRGRIAAVPADVGTGEAELARA